MPEFVPLPEIRMKVRDVFSVGDLLKSLEEWFQENNYGDLDGSDDYETLYTHALRAGGVITDTWFWMRTIKYPIGTSKDTAFLRYRLNVDMHYLGESAETEVMHKGKKVKLNKGEMEFFINAAMEIDFRDEWKKGGMMGMLSEVFKKKLYKKQLKYHKRYLYDEMYKFQGMLKQFFGLATFVPEQPMAQPPRGLMQ